MLKYSGKLLQKFEKRTICWSFTLCVSLWQCNVVLVYSTAAFRAIGMVNTSLLCSYKMKVDSACCLIVDVNWCRARSTDFNVAKISRIEIDLRLPVSWCVRLPVSWSNGSQCAWTKVDDRPIYTEKFLLVYIRLFLGA